MTSQFNRILIVRCAPQGHGSSPQRTQRAQRLYTVILRDLRGLFGVCLLLSSVKFTVILGTPYRANNELPGLRLAFRTLLNSSEDIFGYVNKKCDYRDLYEAVGCATQGRTFSRRFPHGE